MRGQYSDEENLSVKKNLVWIGKFTAKRSIGIVSE